MDIKLTHIDYETNYPRWQKAQDAFDGQFAVKKHDRDLWCSILKMNIELYYLSPTDGMLNSDAPIYQHLLNGAVYAELFSKVIEAYQGLVFRKEPNKDLTKEVKQYENNISIDGLNIDTFTGRWFEQVLLKNRTGILVDMPVKSNDIMTRADADNAGVKPYLAMYTAERILYWETAIHGGVEKTTKVVLDESFTSQKQLDESITLVHDNVKRYRVLLLDDLGIYKQQIWQFNGNVQSKESLQLVGEVTPLANGNFLYEIPFVCSTSMGHSWKITTPITEKILNVDMGHYRNSGDYENSLRLTASPTPVIAGRLSELSKTESGLKFSLGANKVIEVDEGGSATFLEYSGSGIEPIKDAMEDKERLIGILSSQLLVTNKKGVEAAETVRLNQNTGDSILAAIAKHVSKDIEKTLNWFTAFGGGNGSNTYQLNTDYTPGRLPSQDLTAYGNELAAGHISFDTYYNLLQKGEMYPDGWTKEDEQKAIEDDQERNVELLTDDDFIKPLVEDGLADVDEIEVRR